MRVSDLSHRWRHLGLIYLICLVNNVNNWNRYNQFEIMLICILCCCCFQSFGSWSSLVEQRSQKGYGWVSRLDQAMVTLPEHLGILHIILRNMVSRVSIFVIRVLWPRCIGDYEMELYMLLLLGESVCSVSIWTPILTLVLSVWIGVVTESYLSSILSAW